MKKLIVAMMIIALVVVMAVSVSAEDLTEGIYTYAVNEDGQTVTIKKITVTETMELDIPSTIAGKTVTAIGEKALRFGSSNKLVTKLTIPNTVVEIGASAFDNNRGIKELVIPDSVKTIGAQAFIKFDALETLTIGKGLETVGSAAFGRTISLKSITVSSENTNFKVENDCLVDIKNKGVLTGLNVETIIIPTGVEYLDAYSFYGKTAIKTVVIPEGVTTLKTNTFNCASNLETLAIPKSLKTVEDTVTPNTKLSKVYYAGTEADREGVSINETANAKISGKWTYNACLNNTTDFTHSEGETCTYCNPPAGGQTPPAGGTTPNAPQTGSSVTVLAIVAVVALAATSVVISKRRIED